MDIRSTVADKYGELEKCYGHCEQPATLKFLNNEVDPVVTGYSCHGAYLSRVIIYAGELKLRESTDAIAHLVGKESEVKEEDVRIASRYPWDMDVTSADPGKLMMVAYWTQNYRRTKSEDPDRNAVFLCANCNSIFSQHLTSAQVLCPSCRTKRLPDL